MEEHLKKKKLSHDETIYTLTRCLGQEQKVIRYFPISRRKLPVLGIPYEKDGGRSNRVYSSLPSGCRRRTFSARVLRVAYATASTLQLVSGMSYMAALMLVQEPVEAMAYATLVTLLQVHSMSVHAVK